MPYLEIRDLAKRFDGQAVLDGIDLDVEEGELLALLGPSGSGKTTLLRAVAGLETPDRGAIVAAGEEVTEVPASKRGFGMVFQHYALFPHMTVGENVAFGLEGWGLPAERIESRVAEVLELVDLAGFEARRVTQISGGQQQRVALARALAPKPRLLLLDEPLSNLDPELRDRTRRRLRRTLRTVGVTTLLVTHEQDEAFELGDRVAVLGDGRLQQVAPPDVLYAEPANRFVAGFVGRTAVLPGTLLEGGRVVVGEDDAGRGIFWRGVVVGDLEAGARVELVVRPEALAVAAWENDPLDGGPADADDSEPSKSIPAPSRRDVPPGLPGVVRERRFAGMVSYLTVELEREQEDAPGGGARGGRRAAGEAPGGGRRVEVATTEPVGVGESVLVTLSGRGPVPRVFAAPAGTDGPLETPSSASPEAPGEAEAPH